MLGHPQEVLGLEDELLVGQDELLVGLDHLQVVLDGVGEVGGVEDGEAADNGDSPQAVCQVAVGGVGLGRGASVECVLHAL